MSSGNATSFHVIAAAANVVIAITCVCPVPSSVGLSKNDGGSVLENEFVIKGRDVDPVVVKVNYICY